MPPNPAALAAVTSTEECRKRAIRYYDRPEVLDALFLHASGRRVTGGRDFQTTGRRARQTSDLRQILLRQRQDGRVWPSLHGTVGRRDTATGGWVGVDLVVEVDFKKSWERCFAMTRPLARILDEHGVPYCAKFSGNASLHLIVPAEAFPEGLQWDECGGLFQEVLRYLNRHVRGAGHLDASFQSRSHFLRLPYSLNEMTGLVSLPLLPGEIERFDPAWASPERATIRDRWWRVPRDAASSVRAFLRRAARAELLAAAGVDLSPAARERRSGSARAVRAAPPARRPPRVPGLLGEQEYRACVQQGRSALAAWMAMMDEGEASDEDRRLDRYLGHYAREDVQRLVFGQAADRVVAIGGLVALVDRADEIAPLAAFAALEEGRWTPPSFRVTATRYDPETGLPAGEDLVLRIHPEVGGDTPFGASAAPLAELWDRLGVFYRLQFDGRDSLLVALPAETLTGARNALAPADWAMLPGLILALVRRLCGHGEGRCSVTLDSLAWLPVAYALDPESGLSSLPIPPEEAAGWRRERAHPDALDALPDWPEPPPGAGILRLLAELST